MKTKGLEKGDVEGCMVSQVIRGGNLKGLINLLTKALKNIIFYI